MRHYNSRTRVLVTGGAGFLGSHLCERLLAAGNDVLCVDNFFTGTNDNIAHLLSNQRVVRWGGRSSDRASGPRISMAFDFQRRREVFARNTACRAA